MERVLLKDISLYSDIEMVLNRITLMTTIIIHPKTKEEITLFEYLAKRLKTPYEINTKKSTEGNKKPSDFFGTISEKEGEKMLAQLTKNREEWERNIG